MSEAKEKKPETFEELKKEIEKLDYSKEKVSQSITKINSLYPILFNLDNISKDKFAEITLLISDSLGDNAWKFWIEMHTRYILENSKKKIAFYKEFERKYLVERLDKLKIDMSSFEVIKNDIKEFKNTSLNTMLTQIKKRFGKDELVEVIALLYMQFTYVIYQEVIMASNKTKCLKMVNKSFIQIFSLPKSQDNTLSVGIAKTLLKANPLEKLNEYCLLYEKTDEKIAKLEDDLDSEKKFVLDQIEEIKSLNERIINAENEKQQAVETAHKNDDELKALKEEVARLNIRCNYFEQKSQEDFQSYKQDLVRKLNKQSMDYMNNIEQVMVKVDEKIRVFVSLNLQKIKEYIKSLED